MKKIILVLFAAIECLFLSSPIAGAANNAQFVSQNVPTTMTAGQTYQVSVTMKNNGTTVWTYPGGYKLGAQNPQDNWIWGFNRVYLASGESVAVGQSKTFTFNIKAPSTAGSYNFKWQMVQEHVQWFGGYSTNAVVTVIKPKSPLMERMKSKGCVWEGLFSNYGGSETDSLIALLNRSGCQYLHRSVETWAYPPNFYQVQSNIAKVTRQNIVYGMFLAEAISTNAAYYYPDENRNFNFASMCVSGSQGQWGKNTCIPSYKSAEYQKYLRFITRKAIDIGIQDFTFGQVYLCDNLSNPVLPGLVDEMRQYAQTKGKEIVIGAQTNDIQSEGYLRIFDYVTAGLGIDEDGNIETGKCASKFSASGFCWALVYNEPYASKFNDILVYHDWDSRCADDMSMLSRMADDKRRDYLKEKYNYFTSKGMGFLIPYLGVLCGDGRGCYGPNKWYYSPDNKYSCKDEDAINEIFAGIIAKKADLSRCAAASDCASNICLDGYCGLKPNGWGCGSNSVCASASCVNGVCTAKTSMNGETDLEQLATILARLKAFVAAFLQAGE